MKHEENLQLQVCQYLRYQYPEILFRSDMAGVKLTMGQAIAAARVQSGRAWPDLFIAEPRGKANGLFLELKKEGTRIYLRDGSLTIDKHINEQALTLEKLKQKGFEAYFAIGFNEAMRIIDRYLSYAEEHYSPTEEETTISNLV